MLVHEDEAGWVGWQPRQAGPRELCKRDYLIDLDCRSGVKVQLAALDPLPVSTRPQPDPPVGEEPAQHLARRGTEDRQWILLGRDDGQLDAGHSSLGQMRGGEERELIQWQRPTDRGRVDEAQPLVGASLESLEQGAELGYASPSGEVQCPPASRVGERPPRRSGRRREEWRHL